MLPKDLYSKWDYSEAESHTGHKVRAENSIKPIKKVEVKGLGDTKGKYEVQELANEEGGQPLKVDLRKIPSLQSART